MVISFHSTAHPPSFSSTLPILPSPPHSHMISNFKVPPNSTSLGNTRHRTSAFFFSTCCKSIPQIMEIHNLHDVVSPYHLRRNANLTNCKGFAAKNWSYRTQRPSACFSHMEPWLNEVEEKVALSANYANNASSIEDLSIKGLPLEAERLVLGMISEGLRLDISTLSALMLCYANNGLFSKAHAVWDEILHSSFLLDVQVVAKLIDIYGCMGYFDMVVKILHQVRMKDSNMLSRVYAMAISSFGKRGQLELMEIVLKEMVTMGLPVDSATGNAYVIYYSRFGSLTEMECAYMRVKRSRILIEEEAIRSVSTAYIKAEKFYDLGQFLRGVGLGRRNVGNLLWNLLLLSYAAQFKMKSLQREFVGMVEDGFHPDLTTFNIRLLAFSKMSLFWDLHVSLEHMKHEKVVPDLVTYGSVVDAYLDRRLGRNLDFAVNKMNINDRVVTLTNPLVFEAMGKGDFHLSSEAFMEFSRKKSWTYKELIKIYLRKKFRSNQIFWNY